MKSEQRARGLLRAEWKRAMCLCLFIDLNQEEKLNFLIFVRKDTF